MDNFKRKYHYFGQNTQEWHEMRLGKFTSSQVYRLFGQVTKKDKIRAAIEGLNDGSLVLTHGADLDIITNSDMNDVWEVLHPNKPVSDPTFQKAKKELKNFIAKKGTLENWSAALLDIILGAQIVDPLPKSALTYIEELVIEICYEKQDAGDDYKATDWGDTYEPLARQHFLKNNIYAADKPKIAFCELVGMETGTSPDDTENKVKPSEYKCPMSKKIHKQHTKLKTDLDLLAFDPQKYYQIHHQIFCLGAKRGYWSSYDDRLTEIEKMKHKALHTIKIERNEELCKQFISRIAQATQIRDKMVAEFRAA